MMQIFKFKIINIFSYLINHPSSSFIYRLFDVSEMHHDVSPLCSCGRERRILECRSFIFSLTLEFIIDELDDYHFRCDLFLLLLLLSLEPTISFK